MEKDFADRGGLNPHAERYREKLREHLRSGLPGAILGLVVITILDICLTIFAINNGGVNIFELVATIVLLTIFGTIVFALIFAGIPYGWRMVSRVLDRFTGRQIIVIDILIYLFLLMLKLMAAALIGCYFYPVLLAYYFIRSRQTKQKVRMWAAIIIGVVLLLGLFIGLYTNLNAKSNAAEEGETVETVVPKVEAASFDEQEVLLKKICDNALTATKEKETDYITSYGWEITETSQIHGVFFMEAENANRPHYINSKLSLSNAVAIVTGYYLVQAGPVTVNQWEMDVKIYPNFSFDGDNVLVYDVDNVRSHALRSDDMDDLVEWLRGEYDDMMITEIEYL